MMNDQIRPVARGYADAEDGITEMRVDLVVDPDGEPHTVASLSVEEFEIFEAECRVAILRASKAQVDVLDPDAWRDVRGVPMPRPSARG